MPVSRNDGRLNLVITATMLLVFLGLMALRTPVSISIGVASALGVFMAGVPLEIVPRKMTEGVDGFALLAVPFFVLAANLMNSGGVTRRIFDFARALLGHIHGGLAHVNVGASMIFSGMSGAALADLAGLGAVEMKAMRESGYRAEFAAGLTLASCTIGVIIPPSISFVIYALVTGESTGRLFLAGVVPGILIGASLMITVYAWARLRPDQFSPPEPFRLGRLFNATRESALALLLPGIIVACLVLGVATVTEVGVIAVIYALLLGFVYREHSLTGLRRCLVESLSTTALIMYILAVSTVMGWVITSERDAHDAAWAISEAVDSPLAALALINLFLLIVGMVLEPLPALLITSSILHPVITSIGIDPVHFGVIICFNLILGIVTPPMGIGLFVAARVANIPVEGVLKGTIPFLLPLFASLAVITLFPQISLWLPDLIYGPRP